MKKVILQNLILLLFLIAFSAKDDLQASPENNNPIVKADATYKVLIKRNITYAEGLSHDGKSASTVAIPLKLDVYVPDNDLKNRPVYMFMHGGSFKGGSRKKKDIAAMGNYFSSRGWVFVSIDYRVLKNLGTIHTGIAPQKWIDASNNNSQMIAVYTAQRDAKAAMRWIVANADTYHINTNFITVGGGSAGAITAIGIGISEQEDFRDEISTTVDPTLLTTNLNETYKIRSIIDFWGNDIVLNLLKKVYGHDRFDSNNPELFIAHGTEDKRLVPYSGALDLIEIYKSTGVFAKLVPLEGRRHAAWDAVVDGKNLSDLTFDFLVERQNLRVEN
jgi:acetyl esterase/lipase